MKNSFHHIYYRKKFLSAIFISASIMTLLDIPVSIYQGLAPKAIVQGITVLTFVLAEYYLRKMAKNLTPISLIVFTLSFALGISFTVLNVNDQKSIYWFLIFPSAILFTLSLKFGIYWILCSYLVLIPLLAYQTFKTNIPVAEAINFILGYSFAFITAYFIEKSRTLIEDKLNTISITDFLTTAKNRRGFDIDFHSRIKSCTQLDKSFCLILIDLDHFKSINDTYGHSVGDQVLIEFVEIIQKKLKSGDIIYRIGGEEFAIILDEAKLEQAHEFAEVIRATINEKQFSKIGNLTVSMGVLEYQKGLEKDETLREADRLLYAAKNNGRNRIETQHIEA